MSGWLDGWRAPRSLTCLVDLDPASLADARARLAALAPELESRLSQASGLHSLRFCLLRYDLLSQDDGARPCARLLLNTVHDGNLDEHLQQLASAAGDELAQALAVAPAFSGRTADLPAFLLAHRVPNQTVHLGVIGRTVDEVRAESRLRDELGAVADRQIASGAWPAGTPAEQIRRELRRHVEQLAATDLPRGPRPPQGPSARLRRFLDVLALLASPVSGVLAYDVFAAAWRLRPWWRRLGALVGLVPWALYTALPTGLAFAGVRLLEAFERDVVAPPPDEDAYEQLLQGEDRQAKNHLSMIIPVRASWLRRWLLRLVLWSAERGCRHLWTDGRLAGIDTIHYARILQVDGDRQLIFLSDYDGSWERYLDDFLDVGSRAVIPIAANLEGCPPTRWLYWPIETHTFVPRFRSLLRRYQVDAPVWYSAFPGLTVHNVLNNAALRDGLFVAQMAEDDARRWLRRL